VIFMHKKSGELFELLIVSLDESGLIYYIDTPTYRIDKFALEDQFYDGCISQGDIIEEFTEHFEFVGFL
jgi:hypothetical protein